jgi:hypothetical protein
MNSVPPWNLLMELLDQEDDNRWAVTGRKWNVRGFRGSA